MQLSFREWEDSALARRAAAALGRDEVQVWLATTPSDEAGLRRSPASSARMSARARNAST